MQRWLQDIARREYNKFQCFITVHKLFIISASRLSAVALITKPFSNKCGLDFSTRDATDTLLSLSLTLSPSLSLSFSLEHWIPCFLDPCNNHIYLCPLLIVGPTLENWLSTHNAPCAQSTDHWYANGWTWMYYRINLRIFDFKCMFARRLLSSFCLMTMDYNPQPNISRWMHDIIDTRI